MFALIKTFALSGIESTKIDVEVHASSGLPVLNIVGLANRAVSESKERVRSAITSMGLALPAKRITINLSPSDIQKEGTHYDLPIALGLLVAMEILPQERLSKFIAMGELSLNGSIKYINGAMPAVLMAMENDLGVICPYDNFHEAAFISSGKKILAPRSLMQLINYFNSDTPLEPPKDLDIDQVSQNTKDLSDVIGQTKAKRALEIAITGGHNMIMVGAPGSGKSMIAERAIGLLPPLSPSQALETSMLHSISGLLANGKISSSNPFRTPHHSASIPSIVGGGRFAKPGEISLAHNGILFMDEFAEFPSSLLDSLRQPMETGKVSISRAESHVTYPAKFQLIAAMNPCKCGYFGDVKKQCSFVPGCAQKYMSKISGPIMERIDIQTSVSPEKINLSDIREKDDTYSTAATKKRIIEGRQFQKSRYKSDVLNASLSNSMVEEFCKLDTETSQYLEKINVQYDFSMREYHKILKVSRTIADLHMRDTIMKNDIIEALSFRMRLM